MTSTTEPANSNSHSETSSTSKPQHQSRRFYLLTHPRTASNLLIRILNREQQPNVLPDCKNEYFFLPMNVQKFVIFHRQHLNEWSEKERETISKCYQSCFDDLENHVQTAEAHGKDVFVKEHVAWLNEPVAEMKWAHNDKTTTEEPWMVDAPNYGRSRSDLNLTIFSDEYLLSWRPTFLIRHPALVFPSLYRTTRDIAGDEEARNDPGHVVEMSLRWLRILYDFYQEKREQIGQMSNDAGGEQWPIVIDADDVIESPQTVYRYCQMVGFDPSQLKFDWDLASKDQLNEMHAFEKRMKSTLTSSTGIVKGKSSTGLTIEEEAKKWKDEFGEDEGAKIERWVYAAMPDYEYLRGKKLRPAA